MYDQSTLIKFEKEPIGRNSVYIYIYIYHIIYRNCDCARWLCQIAIKYIEVVLCQVTTPICIKFMYKTKN